MDRNTGLMVNPNLEQYKVRDRGRRRRSTSCSSRTIKARARPTRTVSRNPSNIATAPAIANAVYNAIGVRMRELPMTPARVLAALGKATTPGHSSMKALSLRSRSIRRRGHGLGFHDGRAAMIVDRAHRTTCILKAGGIDLLDLMKEGFRAARARRRTADPESGRHQDSGATGVRIGPLVTLAKLGDALVQARYTALRRRPGRLQARKFATSPRWEGTCFSGRAAGIFARATSIVCARAADTVSRSTARTSITPCSTTRSAPSSIRRPSRPRSSHSGLRSNSPTRRGDARTLLLENVSALECGWTSIARTIFSRKRCSPRCNLPLLSGRTRSVHLKQGEKDSFDWPIAESAVVIDRAADGRCLRATVVLGAAAPVPHRARAAEAFLDGYAHR